MSEAEPRMKVPASAKSAARNALKARASASPSQKFGTSVGIARAHQLIEAESISLTDARNIYAFLSRHEANYKKARNKEELQKVEGAVGLWGNMGW